MKITKKQLKRLIREAIIVEAGYSPLPYKDGRPWEDPELYVEPIPQRDDWVDPLDQELTDEEMDDAGYFEEEGWPLTIGYIDENGEDVEFVVNNDEESEQFFSLFFKKYGRSHPYSVN